MVAPTKMDVITETKGMGVVSPSIPLVFDIVLFCVKNQKNGDLNLILFNLI